MRLVELSAVACTITLFVNAPARAQTGGSCGTWETVPTPNSHPVENYLTDTARTPGGGFVTLGYGYLLEWNGTGWTEIPYPDYTNLGIGIISGIGTTPEGDLWGVGLIVEGPGDSSPLVAHWDGTEWDMVEPVHLSPQVVWPFGMRSGHANAVDGASANDVWVTGITEENGSGTDSSPILMLHWDGNDWTEHFPPAPGAYQNDIFAIEARAGDDVWAVGENIGTPAIMLPLIIHWDGTSWSESPTPAPNGTIAKDVAAIAADDVWVVGQGQGAPLFMHYDGSAWSLVDPPADAMSISAAQVTAFASDDVWAVSGYLPEFYHWDGTSWSTMPANDVPGYDTVNRGRGLVALGPCDVWSVGSLWLGNTRTNFAEHLQFDDTPLPPTGDVNSDGFVNVDDIVEIILGWGPCPGSPIPCPCDVTGDGRVDVDDIVLAILNWS